jgi:hypothetical protein
MKTKEKIIERLVEYHRTANCDRYGQLGTIMASEIAKTPEELNALSTIVQVQTYGGRFGTYQGFNNYSFKDATVKEKCSEAFRENPSRSNV